MSYLCIYGFIVQLFVVGAQTSRKVQCKYILLINFACAIPSSQRLQSATCSSTISENAVCYMISCF